MYLTDAEARTKECPLRSTKSQKVKCTASDCIAWNWDPSCDCTVPGSSCKGYCAEITHQFVGRGENKP